MRYHFYTADVFTSLPLSGNQLAVFPDGSGLGSSCSASPANSTCRKPPSSFRVGGFSVLVSEGWMEIPL